eukprot:GILJ01001238.1.p2 GENE.GILJ01001238.1~~GILJ01001238.1.p2  ORF type:complete len:135 (+),score=14.11 GILJ01001238.1:1495-1899(+)
MYVSGSSSLTQRRRELLSSTSSSDCSDSWCDEDSVSSGSSGSLDDFDDSSFGNWGSVAQSSHIASVRSVHSLVQESGVDITTSLAQNEFDQTPDSVDTDEGTSDSIGMPSDSEDSDPGLFELSLTAADSFDLLH